MEEPPVPLPLMIDESLFNPEEEIKKHKSRRK